MKRVTTFLAVFLIITGSVMAQKPKKPVLSVEERATKQTEHVQSVTNCSTEQAALIKAASVAKYNKIDAIREKYKGNKDMKEVKKAEINVVRKEFHAELKKILNAEQLKKLHDFHKAKKQNKNTPPEDDDSNDYKE